MSRIEEIKERCEEAFEIATQLKINKELTRKGHATIVLSLQDIPTLLDKITTKDMEIEQIKSVNADIIHLCELYIKAGITAEQLSDWIKAEQNGRLVMLPPKSEYGNTDIDDAIRYASYTCSVTNNEQNRLILDALIEKQIREEKAATLCRPCPQCGRNEPLDSRFCKNCGLPLNDE